MPQLLQCLILAALTLGLPVDTLGPARLSALPDALVLTRVVQGAWDDEDDLLNEAFEAVEQAAQQRGLLLGTKRVVIREVMGPKTFKSRAGYVIETYAQPAVLGNGLELHKLPHAKAWVADGKGDADALTKTRRRVLDEVEKPGVNRFQGVELLEIFDGDPDEDATPFAIYAPIK